MFTPSSSITQKDPTQRAPRLTLEQIVVRIIWTTLWLAFTGWMIYDASARIKLLDLPSREHPWDAVLKLDLGPEQDWPVGIVLGIIVIGGSFLVAAWRNRIGANAPIAPLHIISTPDGLRLRLRQYPPGPMFFVSLIGFVIAHAIVFSIFDINLEPPFVWLSWILVVSAAAGVGLWRKWVENSGREDVVISGHGHHLTLPLLCGRKTALTISRETIADITLQIVHRTNDDSSWNEYFPTIALTDGTKHPVAKFNSDKKARAVFYWMREQMNLTYRTCQK
ncbi:MAG: hypothetical protein JWM68_5212 [Verrucomicrobiales bacterium]|nr:hypothetical protein [Verrucomicrobiales bacterium]